MRGALVGGCATERARAAQVLQCPVGEVDRTADTRDEPIRLYGGCERFALCSSDGCVEVPTFSALSLPAFSATIDAGAGRAPIEVRFDVATSREWSRAEFVAHAQLPCRPEDVRLTPTTMGWTLAGCGQRQTCMPTTGAQALCVDQAVIDAATKAAAAQIH